MKNRIAGLDLFRSVAILTVVVGHGKPILASVGSAFPYASLPDGVEMFFVLSGFLIGQVLMSGEWRSWGEFMRFWERRWRRTLPNYYLFLGLNLLLSVWLILPTRVAYFDLSFLVFGQNLWGGFVGFYWESWSLSVEEWFYLLFPLLLWVLPSGRWGKLGAILIFLLVPMGLRYWKAMGYLEGISGEVWDVEFRKVVLLRLDAIGFGVLVAWLKYYYGNIFVGGRWYFGLGFLGLHVGLGYVELPLNSVYKLGFELALEGAAYALSLPLVDGWRSMGIWNWGLSWLSRISYSMYLSNLLILQVILHYRPIGSFGVVEAWGLLGLYMGLVLGLSWVCYVYFERRFLTHPPSPLSLACGQREGEA